MSKIERQLDDYRQLRDASRKTLMADIEHARTSFSAKGLTSRYLGGVAEGAKDVYEVTKVHAVDNRGVIAIVLGALALWFGREPLLAAMEQEIEAEETAELELGDDDAETVQPSDTDASANEPSDDVPSDDAPGDNVPSEPNQIDEDPSSGDTNDN